MPSTALIPRVSTRSGNESIFRIRFHNLTHSLSQSMYPADSTVPQPDLYVFVMTRCLYTSHLPPRSHRLEFFRPIEPEHVRTTLQSLPVSSLWQPHID